VEAELRILLEASCNLFCKMKPIDNSARAGVWPLLPSYSTPPALRDYPGDDFDRIADVAGLSVDAVVRNDFIFWPAAPFRADDPFHIAPASRAQILARLP